MDINKIIDKWLDFLEFEDIERSKFNIDNLKNFEFIDISKNVNNNNTIIINKNNIDIIHKKYPVKKMGSKDINKIFLLFPLIKESYFDKSSNKNIEFIYPLFAIDLTSEKINMFNSKTDFNFPFDFNDSIKYSVLLNVFQKIFGLEKNFFSKKMSLIELINELTNKNSKNFEESFKNLQFYIKENIELFQNEKFSLYNKEAIISKIDISPFNEDLINEFNILKDIEIDEKQELIHQYINEESNNQKEINLNKKNFWKGSFSNFPLSTGQSIVMQKFQDNKDKILAVQGGPGTGKTTLILNIMASQITNRRLNIAKNKNDYNNLMLITSTSNKAVDNISERFSIDFPKHNNLYFVGGNLYKIKESILRLNKLEDKIKNEDFNQSKFEKLKQAILKIEKSFLQEQHEYVSFVKEIFRLEQKHNLKIELIIQKIKKEINKKLNLKNNEDLELFQIETKIKKEIDNYYLHIKEKENLKNKLSKEFNIIINKNLNLNLDLDKLYNFTQENLKLFKTLEIDLNQIIGIKKYFNIFMKYDIKLLEDFNIKNEKLLKEYNIPKLNKENYINILSNISIIIDKVFNKKDLLEDFNDYMYKRKYIDIKNYENTLKFVYSSKDIITKFTKLNNHYNNSYREYFRIQKYKMNLKLFKLSEEFMYQYTLKNKKDSINTLNHWKNVLIYSKNTKDSLEYIEHNMDFFAKNLSMIYPVITTTLSSIRNILKLNIKHFKDNPLFDLSICEERGMVGVHNLFPALFRSKKSIVIGDPKQLVPIVPLTKNVIEQYYNTFENDDNYNKYSPSYTTAYHRSSFCKTRNYSDIGKSIILDEHRRCQKDIADLFIEISNYENIKNKTPQLKFLDNSEINQENNKMFYVLKSFDNKNLIFYNVKKKINSRINTNINEINKIEEILKKLKENGVDLDKDVRIITPFVNQEKMLINKFGKLVNHTFKLAKIGTVHKFQGTEFPIVIFSSVISGNDSSDFINETPNMLNVALSRRKYMFITVGDFVKLKNSGKYLFKLTKACYQKGKYIK